MGDILTIRTRGKDHKKLRTSNHQCKKQRTSQVDTKMLSDPIAPGQRELITRNRE